MTRRRAAAHFARPRRWSAEVLEPRRLLSAAAGDDHAGDLGDDHGDHGERYVAPKVKAKKGKAPKLSPAAQQDLALDDAGSGSDLNEAEGNNTPGTATPITFGPTNNVITGAIGTSGDLDYFSFTLTQRAGLFLDVDAKDIGLSNLDSRVTVYNSTGGTVIAENDDGDDFEQFALNDTTATPHSDDASLYVDLNPGSYLVRVSASTTATSSTGAYQFKVRSDTSYTTTVPSFDSYYPYSFPGQTHTDTLYLDFNGHSSSTDAWTTRDIDPNTAGVQANGPYTIAPFDLNGNPNEWTPGERAVIENVWRVVAEDFRPFNVNVSTREPASIADGVAHRQVIGNSTGAEVNAGGSLGIAFRPSYNSGGSNNNVAFTFASNFTYVLGSGAGAAGMSGWIGAAAVEMGNTSSHEFGHALGLRHYGGSTATQQLNGIMHTPDFGLSRERWKVGNTHDGESTPVFQDDVAVISGTSNTFGYLPDDIGNTTGTAATMPLVDGAFRRGGVIGQKTDVDMFRFDSRGMTTVSVSMLEHVANLDAELRLYNSAGTLLATSDPSTAITATITQDLPQGTYYAEVRSDGGDGEIGSYDLTVVSPATNPSLTPGNPMLQPGSDTGHSSFDGLTNRNNSSAASNLVFRVSAAVPGSTVTIYADGVAVGSAVASTSIVDITTNGTTTLADGSRVFTARQTEPGKFESPNSSQTFVTIDTVVPTVDVTDVTPDPRATPVTSIEVKFSRPVSGFGMNDLTLTRDGVSVPMSVSAGPSTSDSKTWTIPVPSSSTTPAGTYVFSVNAAGSGITDNLAGNALAVGASDTWVNNNAPPTIGSLTASPDRIYPGQPMTLTASDVADANGTAGVGVTFYRESNGSAGLQVGSDAQVGATDTTSPYTVTFNAPTGVGTLTYYARAVDPALAASAPAAVIVNVLVPITPTPGAPDLVPAFDSGVSDSDNVVNPFLVSPTGTLQFDVPGTVAGATVRIYVDGVVAGNAQSQGGVTRVTTFEDFRFSSAAHVITARQYETGAAESEPSPPITVVTDELGPGAQIEQVMTSGGPRRTPVPSLDITFNEPVEGFGADDLVLTRWVDGQVSGNLLTAGNTLTTSDGQTFTLTDLASLTSAPGAYRLAFAAAGTTPGPAVFDVAGNRLDPGGYNEVNWSTVSDPARVIGVFVAGTAWTSAYRNNLEASGQGEAAYGYRIAPWEQTRTLGWSNLNQVSIRFTHPVNISAGHLVLNGVNVPQYLLADANGFRYDAATNTATWTVRRLIPNDKVAINLDGDASADGPGVTDAETGELLDGEWTNPVHPSNFGDTFPSGDGTAGGDFVFNLRVLPGDVTRDGAVDVFDYNVIRANLNLSGVGLAEGDLSGDALVSVVDFNEYRAYLGRTTPA